MSRDFRLFLSLNNPDPQRKICSSLNKIRVDIRVYSSIASAVRTVRSTLRYTVESTHSLRSQLIHRRINLLAVYSTVMQRRSALKSCLGRMLGRISDVEAIRNSVDLLNKMYLL